MKNLPLFYYPTRWVWVDDDAALVKTAEQAFSKYNTIVPFVSAKKCWEFLNSYESPLLKQNFLKSNTETENYGILQSTPVDFNITNLAKLADVPKRHEEVTAMVIDYQMPEMDGITLAEKIKALPFKKILLTGQAEESFAIEAFNNKLIDCFIQKTKEDVVTKLTNHLNDLTIQYFINMTQHLLAYLETEGRLPLTDPTFMSFFESFRKDNRITEYYLMDKQGGFLCIDHNGNRLFLVVHTAQSIDNWLKVYSKNDALPETELSALRGHKKVPFFGAGIEAWQVDPQNWVAHLYDANILEGRDRYYWSVVK